MTVPDATAAADSRDAAAESSPRWTGAAPRLWDRVLFLILQIVYSRFRYDVFISYRRHYKDYVTKLKQQLEHLGYRAFFDGEECPPGSELNKTLRDSLRRSAALVLVGSHDVESPYVTMEVTTFGATGRTIIPIDVDGALAACTISVIHERDLVWINESGAAFDAHVPSPDVVAGIEANFAYLKRNVRRRIEGALVAALVVVISAGSVGYARRNVAIARADQSKASAQAQEARARATQAETRRAEADAAAADARKAKEDADRLAGVARRAAQEEQGQRASLLASEAGREHDALLAGVLAVGPQTDGARVPPTAAMYGLTEAVAAAARSLPMAAGVTRDSRITEDGRRIVTIGDDGVRWWESETGRLIRHLKAGKESRAAFCGESGLIVVAEPPTGSGPTEIHLWDMATERVWTTVSALGVSACSRSRKWVVMVREGQARLWDLHARADLGAFPAGTSHLPPQFSGDDTRLISATGIFEVPSRRLIARLENPAQRTARKDVVGARDFHTLKFFGDDRFIAGASALGNVVVWRADDGTLLHSFEVTKPRYSFKMLAVLESVHDSIDRLAVSPDGKHLAVADIDNRITVWNVQAGPQEPVVSLNVLAIEDAPQRLKLVIDREPEFGAVTDLQFYDAKTLVFITETGRLYIQTFDGNRLDKRMALAAPEFSTNLGTAKDRRPGFTLGQGGRELVTFGCFPGVRRWAWGAEGFKDVLKDHARMTFEVGGGAAFSLDNRFVVVEDEGKRRSIWDRDRGARLPHADVARQNVLPFVRPELFVWPSALEIFGGSEPVEALPPGELDKGVRSATGQFFATCCPAVLWDVADRRPVLRLRGAARDVQFAPDERDVLAGSRTNSHLVYSLNPAWYLGRACRILREADRSQTADICPIPAPDAAAGLRETPQTPRSAR